MKILYSIFILFSLTSFSQISDSKENIKQFIEEYFIVEEPNISFDSLPNYLNVNIADYNSLDENKKEVLRKYILLLIDIEHKELKKNDFNYSLVKHSELKLDMIKNYRLVYNDLTNVYYMVIENKILTHFILDVNNKIISFAPNVFTTHVGRVEPFMLDSFKD